MKRKGIMRKKNYLKIQNKKFSNLIIYVVLKNGINIFKKRTKKNRKYTAHLKHVITNILASLKNSFENN